MNYTVYKIKNGTAVIYYGYSKNLHQRQQSHQYACYNTNNKAHSYLLYQYWRSIYPDKLEGRKRLKLTPIRTFKTKTKAKQYEAYLILKRFFDGKKLYQKIPSIGR